MAEFSIDQDKIEALVQRAYHALQTEGSELRAIMPQHNLPPEFEHSPKQKGVKEPETAAKYLFTEAWFERKTQSAQIVKACRAAWDDESRRWIFFPEKVANAPQQEINKIMKNLPYTAHRGDSLEVSRKYKHNAAVLKEKFGSDPRRMIQGFTTEQARDNIDRLWGIGKRIANMYIAYLLEREIASPLDPQNAIPKVDIHKTRITLNIGAIITSEREIRRGDLTAKLEEAYQKACHNLSIPAELIDGALWGICSKNCPKKSYHHCQFNCFLGDMCQYHTPEDRKSRRFQIYDENGKRLDSRKDFQGSLFTKHSEQTA